MINLLSALLVLAAAQDKVKIQIRSVAGEAYVHESRETNEGTIVVKIGDMEIPQPMKETEVRNYRDEVLEVESAKASKVRREMREWWQEKTPPGAVEPVKTAKALQGKTIVISRKDGKSSFEGADGIPAAELNRNRLRSEAVFKALPPGPVAVGDTWDVDPKTLLEDFSEAAEAGGPKMLQAKGTGKLEKIEEHKGARCAVVALTIAASGHLPQQEALKMEIAMTARLWIDLDKDRPLTMKGEGAAKLSGSLEQGGQKLSMNGEVKIRNEAEQRWE